MRLFVAVNFSASVRDDIASAIEGLDLPHPPWLWARPETWHLTLKFLGETAAGDVAAIADALESACAGHRAFHLSLGALGGFPDLSRPRVLFYEVEQGAGRLRTLAASVDDALYRLAGIPKDTRPFRAHATVARVKNRISDDVAEVLQSAPGLRAGRQEVAGVDLMESRLDPTGARYTPVKQFALI